MGGTHCAIPGCVTSNSEAIRKKKKRAALFSVLRPEFARTPEIRKHREALRDFMLSLRDDDDGHFKLMLHKESAMICERHFVTSDIIEKANSKQLRIGAMPTINLPKQIALTPPAKKTLGDKEYEELTESDGPKRLGLCCRIPGCNQEVFRKAKETRSVVKYVNFRVKDSTLMQPDDPEYEWYSKMKDFLLEFPNRDTVLDQYDQEDDYICERHFDDADLICYEGKKGSVKKSLRDGAMPSLNLPYLPNVVLYEMRGKTKDIKEVPSNPKKRTVVTHRTFASLVASAKKFSNNKWNLSIEKDLIRFWRCGPENVDQKEISVEINNEFKIGIVFFGWCLPEGHFATEFDMRKNGFPALTEYLETMRSCDGFEVHPRLDIRDEDDVAKHYVTRSSGGFQHGPVDLVVLAHRSKKCDVLLKKPSFGTCKACTQAKMEMKKRAEKEEKLIGLPLTKAPETLETDSFRTIRIKNTMAKKVKECEDLARLLARKPEFLTRHDIKKRVEEEMAHKYMAQKALTFEEYMKPILKYKETNELPDFFETFWRFQLETMWMHTDRKPAIHALRYPEELMRFFGEIYLGGKTGYGHLLKSRTLTMPSRATIKKFSNKLKHDRENSMNSVIGRVADGATEPGSNGTPDLQQVFYEISSEDQYENSLSIEDGQTFDSLQDLQAWRDSLESKTIRKSRTKRKIFYFDDQNCIGMIPAAKQPRILQVGDVVQVADSTQIVGTVNYASEDNSANVVIEVELPSPAAEQEDCGTDEEDEQYGAPPTPEQERPLRIDDLEWVMRSENEDEEPG